ncbi:hypothetical protein C6Y14_05550 [Streptomyces dioscori]|uniref:DUF6924 domain-containing protein n=1 Tax=Streptomyces dioscori TaxID=2109333 RepID=A0A2P8QE58_9ACTN|nr:hypothetical protein [Streptomyces dioscori]PSM44488.1 hypothetical protein C6Y14_05550 [Streptomyces dioscori]
MRVLPKTDADYPPMLLVRTDYRDDDAWQRVLDALDKPWVFDEDDEDNGRSKEEIVRVDDPAWADATPADVLAALTAPEDRDSDGGGDEDGEDAAESGWPVVFLADRASMEGPEPTLLAVSPDPEERTAPYRIPALETPHEMHCNLAIANMDFDEFGD